MQAWRSLLVDQTYVLYGRKRQGLRNVRRRCTEAEGRREQITRQVLCPGGKRLGTLRVKLVYVQSPRSVRHVDPRIIRVR